MDVSIRRKITALIGTAALAVCLYGCGSAAVMAEPEPLKQVSMTVTAENIAKLELMEDLEAVDLSGSTCYEDIEAFAKNHPEIQVTYTVAVGGSQVAHDTQELVLQPGECDYPTLLENLKYLRSVKSVKLVDTDLTPEEVASLSETYANVPISYTVNILGTEYSGDCTELDLSAMTPEQIPEVAEKLTRLPALTMVQLMNADGSSQLAVTDVKLLVEAVPEVLFNYSFELFGKTVSTTDQRIEFVKENIGNEGEQQIRDALAILQSCEYFLLDSCGIDYEILAQIRSDFPETKVVWRVYYGKHNDLTDVETILYTFGLKDSNCYNLRYFNECKNLDIGHNETLTDLSFIEGMTSLEIVIVSGAPITDLTPFKNCPNLMFLELAFCGYLADLSPLEGMTSLKFLNISYSKVKDLTPIMGLELERFNCLQTPVGYDQKAAWIEAHPDCWTRFDGKQPYGIGWRYDDEGITYSDIYRKVRDIFGYDNM